MNIQLLLVLALSILSRPAYSASRRPERPQLLQGKRNVEKFFKCDAKISTGSRYLRLPGDYQTLMNAWEQISSKLSTRGYKVLKPLGGGAGGGHKEVFELTNRTHVVKISCGSDARRHEEEILRYRIPCSCKLGKWLAEEMTKLGKCKSHKENPCMECLSYEEEIKEYLVENMDDSCGDCDMGMILDPRLERMILPTETYIKVTGVTPDKYFDTVVCEIQSKVQMLKDMSEEQQNKYRNGWKREDYHLTKRLNEVGLHDNDKDTCITKQIGVPYGKDYAVYIDIGEMSGQVTSPKSSESNAQKIERFERKSKQNNKVVPNIKVPGRKDEDLISEKTPFGRRGCGFCNGTGFEGGWKIEIVRDIRGRPSYWYVNIGAALYSPRGESDATEWERPPLCHYCSQCNRIDPLVSPIGA